MLTIEQYNACMARIEELLEIGFDNLDALQSSELELLSQRTEEFEAHDHRQSAE